MIHLYFGLQFDNEPLIHLEELEKPFWIAGPKLLLERLEQNYGIAVEDADTEYIRLELYRQAIEKIMDERLFFYASYQADSFSTSLFLLQKREELLIEGFDFQEDDLMSERLQTFCRIEQEYKKLSPPPSYSDRWATISQLTQLENIKLFQSVSTLESEVFIPNYLLKILKNSSQQSDFQSILKGNVAKEQLGAFQKLTQHQPLENMKSPNITWVKAQDEEVGAKWLAKYLSQNREKKSVVFTESPNLLIPLSLKSEGLPIPKTQFYDTARPSLQLLNLVLSFLWKPLEVNHLLDFFSLPIKPFDNRLGFLLAQALADRPGFHLERFEAVLERRLAEPELSNEVKNKCLKYFNFWFKRKQFLQTESIPLAVLKEIIEFVEDWISGLSFHQKQLTSLQSLRYQLDAIRELFELIPESGLSYNQLRNLIFRLNKPLIVSLNEEESDAIPIIYHAGLLAQSTEHLIWFGFNDSGQEQRFNFWTKEEFEFLKTKNVLIQTVSILKNLENQYRFHPILNSTNSLILIELETMKGVTANPHPMNSYLELVTDKSEQTISVFDELSNQTIFNIHNFLEPIISEGNQCKPPHLQLEEEFSNTLKRQKESPSSLEKFIYFPHQWFFQYITKFSEGFQIEISEGNRLKGNIAHKLFQFYFENKPPQNNKNAWFSSTFNYLVETEGSYFHHYGSETERQLFHNQLKRSLFTFEHQLEQDGWEIVGFEQEISGEFEELPLTGYSDLIIKKEGKYAIVDLKWSNEKKFLETMRNNADIQLAFYSNLFANDDYIPTAFYVMDVCRFIQKDNTPFSKALIVNPKIDILEKTASLNSKLKSTINWRKRQLQSCFIEIRAEHNMQFYNELYQDEPLLDYLEIRSSDAYDKFEILILP